MIKLVELVRVSLAEIKYKRMSREKRKTSEEEEDKREREREINFLEEISDLWETDHQTNWRHNSQEICSSHWTVQ